MVPIANGLDTRAAGALERRDSAEAPAYVHGFGSQTLLVNGLDVAEQTSAHGNACCRLYADPSGALRGAPSVEQIVAALQARPLRAISPKPTAVTALPSSSPKSL